MSEKSRGFVLSMALFFIALFLLLYAEAYSSGLFNRQLDKSTIWDRALVSRLAVDARIDLNHLLDQRIRIDQNLTKVRFWLSGRLPSPIDVNANLYRYQDALQTWAGDQNTFAFLDLNSTISDGNVWGLLENGFNWKVDLNRHRLHTFPSSAMGQPIRIDINIYADSKWNDLIPLSLDEDGNVFILLNYSDQNSAHHSIVGGFFSNNGSKQQTWFFDSNQYALTLDVGKLNDATGSLILDHNGTGSFEIRYSIQYTFDANATHTRMGYALPLTFRGNDSNVVESIQWLGG